MALGVTCLFISHQQRDKIAAQKIADYLIRAGINVYFDEYDNDLKIHHQSKNAAAVTNSIRVGINNSSHMLVLISPNTMSSTWVPFEVGYGYDKTALYVLCLKGIEPGTLPEYVKSATIIRDIYDLNLLTGRMVGANADILIKANLINDFASDQNPLSDVMDKLILNDTQ